MLKKFTLIGLMVVTLISCQDNILGTDNAVDVTKVYVNKISDEMAKVRDYVPQNAVIAHRGSTYWVPEETEAAFRWAREMGADYLEADLQVSKDGVILALHDEDLSRTTNIESVYGETIPESRVQYYVDLGYSYEEAYTKYYTDKVMMASLPLKYLPSMYTYEELLALDAGTWFNEANPDQARDGFSTQKQYISTLEDVIQISKGRKIKRDANGDRIYTRGGKTGNTVSQLFGMLTADEVEYTFEYEDDDSYTGHVPGIYLEFKMPMYNPSNIEEMVYTELGRLGMNIITNPESDTEPFYVEGKVNVGNTNGKVILQTFSAESLGRVNDTFGGKVPMCFLLGYASNTSTVAGYAELVNLALSENAHIIGPYIHNSSYPDVNAGWCDYLIESAGMINHPWSFDSTDDMLYAYGSPSLASETETLYNPPYFDAMFTNRTELTLDFMTLYGLRGEGASNSTPNANTVLDNLGYQR